VSKTITTIRMNKTCNVRVT